MSAETSGGEASTIVLDGQDPASIVRAAVLLRSGSVVAVPTDTGYGIAASLFRPASVERVYAIKQRDPALRMPALLATAADLPLVVKSVPPLAWKLIGSFWPGPLSIILPSASGVPRSMTAGKGTVAVRVPAGRTCLSLLQSLGEPVTGTSANISGRPSARTADDVLDQLDGLVDAVLMDDAGIVRDMASTVVEIGNGVITVHRQGAVSIAELRDATSVKITPVTSLATATKRR